MTREPHERSASSFGDCDERRNFAGPPRIVLQMRGRIRDRLTYANVMATIAVFIALGGGAYALTLPRNSVGSRQLRPDSVGRTELRQGAVTSSAISNRSVQLRDVSPSARDSLRGAQGPPGRQGPPGPTFSAAVNAVGGIVKGNANSSLGSGVNGYVIGFSRNVADCVATATLASVPGGDPPSPPPNGHVTVAPTADGKVLVQTWDANGAALPLPFHLVVAC